jgi:hypothetical protein
MDAANVGNLLEVQASLECRAAVRFPVQLIELAEPQGNCPKVRWVLDASPDGDGLRYAGYVWHYKSIDLPQRKGFEIQAISSPARSGGCPRCRSYWLDESKIIRWAVGRPARPDDLQRPREQ